MTAETVLTVPSPLTLLEQGIPLTLLMDLVRVPEADELAHESAQWRASA